jgi:hypothetical protein
MDFYTRLIRYLREQFLKETERLTDTDLMDAIRGGMVKAQKYKFQSEADVVRFIDLQWRMGKNFDNGKEYPWAKEILNNIRIMPKQKIEMLRETYAQHYANLVGENL